MYLPSICFPAAAATACARAGFPAKGVVVNADDPNWGNVAAAYADCNVSAPAPKLIEWKRWRKSYLN